uniref:Uncharacterized protein n=1 Tax=Oryza glumipatula TaxID=40148 RepID=A0A0E0BL78_9ORYZ
MTPPHESPLPPRSSLCALPPSTAGPPSPLPRLLCRTSALAVVPPRDSPPHRALADAVVVPPSARASPGTAPAGAAVVSPSVGAQPGTAPDGAGGSPFCRSRCGARHAGTPDSAQGPPRILGGAACSTSLGAGFSADIQDPASKERRYISQLIRSALQANPACSSADEPPNFTEARIGRFIKHQKY